MCLSASMVNVYLLDRFCLYWFTARPQSQQNPIVPVSRLHPCSSCCKKGLVDSKQGANVNNGRLLFLRSDPWLIRKEPKKGKKNKKKKKKAIDPDSIQSALLASGLGSSRPAFTAPPVIHPAAVKHTVGKSSVSTHTAF